MKNYWQELENKYYMQVVARTPVTLVRGEGARVWDDKGRAYLDFVGGWAVNSLGHCPDVVAEAVTTQARVLIQTSNQFYTVPQIQLARLLVENSCLDRVFIGNSGLEANEAAVKLARRYGALKLNGAYEVITALGSFHGRSLAMTAATGQEGFHKPYQPVPAGFVSVKYDDIEAIKAATTEKTCAVMLEPVQGESGVNVPADDYLKKVRAWCDAKGILLILDEVQTGICRLGPLFGYELYGVEPDIMTLAKGLGSGVPIGAVLAKEHAAVFTLGDHGATFAGNPLTCAAANAVLNYIIEKDVPRHVGRVGQYLMKGLKGLKAKYPFITDARGRGLLTALEFDGDIGQDVLLACLENGLLVNRVKPNAVRLMPPLIIGSQEVDQAVSILDGVFSGIVR
jgi:acetylornithine/N-succinyldiaminopimelate aminotransferase